MQTETGLIFDISHFMTEDGPGIRTTVFVKGCPLRCKWCSNAYGLSAKVQLAVVHQKCTDCGSCIPVCPVPCISCGETGKVVTDFTRCTACGRCRDACPQNARALVGQLYTPDGILKEILKDRDFYRRNKGGATFSGGEILSQASFVEACLIKCREQGIHTAIETSGYGKWEDLRLLLSHSDFVFMDIKAVDSGLHKRLTGVENARILANIRRAGRYCGEHGLPLVLRLPLIPGLNDSTEHVMAAADFVRQLGPQIELNLLPYHKFGVGKYENIGREYLLPELDENSGEKLEECRELFEKAGILYSIGGGNCHKYKD